MSTKLAVITMIMSYTALLGSSNVRKTAPVFLLLFIISASALLWIKYKKDPMNKGLLFYCVSSGLIFAVLVLSRIWP